LACATAHRIGLTAQVGAKSIFVPQGEAFALIARETPHGLFQQGCQGNGIFPDGEVIVAGHDDKRIKMV
jgi:hypothetical protein